MWGASELPACMRSVSLSRGASRRKRPHTTVRSRGVAQSPRPGLATGSSLYEAPDRLWVADMNRCVLRRTGFLYLARTVVFEYSRRVVGWAMQSHLRTELVLRALRHSALSNCEGHRVSSTTPIRGYDGQPTPFVKRCSEWGVRPSMGSVGDCYGTMPYARAFFASLECELLDRRSFHGPHAEARIGKYSSTSRAGTTPTVATPPSTTMTTKIAFDEEVYF